MADYAQVTLQQLQAQLASLLDDAAQVFYTSTETTFAIQEALRVFGALTSYWRTRGSFTVSPSDLSPFYDLSVLLPQYRTRSTTLNSLVQEIQLHLFESPSGISGTGMSGQVSVTTILNALQRARNQFVIDAHLPNNVHPKFTTTPPPDGLVSFPQSSVFVHRAAWQDAGGQWSNLWRQDAWAFDKGYYQWPSAPDTPSAFSEAELAPLELQIFPPPLSAGNIEAVTVDSIAIDITNAGTTFDIPDEWIHAVKYAALADILSSGGQITDSVRAQYCIERYKQAIAFARDATSIIRLTCNGLPLPIDAMTAIDAGCPYWRNQTGPPETAAVLYDLLAITPGSADKVYSITADVVQSAPIPVNAGDYIQIGAENIDDIVNYAAHYLTLKSGGNEFKETMPLYDGFMRAVSVRKGVNAAKIEYFEPLFGMWQREEAYRPDQKVLQGT